jgi:hypothetical protein
MIEQGSMSGRPSKDYVYNVGPSFVGNLAKDLVKHNSCVENEKIDYSLRWRDGNSGSAKEECVFDPVFYRAYRTYGLNVLIGPRTAGIVLRI